MNIHPAHCFSKIIAYVFPFWHCMDTHLNVPDEQTAKTSAFIEVLTLTDDQLIKYIWLAAPAATNPLVTYGNHKDELKLFNKN